MNKPSGNRFPFILLVSMLLHGALLSVLGDPFRQHSSALPPLAVAIKAHLSNNPGQSPPAAVAPAATVPQEARQERPRAERQHPPRPLSTARPADSRIAANAMQQSDDVRPADTPTNPQAAEIPHPASPPAPPSAQMATASPPVAALQGDALAAYRRQLADLFAGTREYPRLAAMRGWEGEVRLRLRVARKGNLLGVVLDRSSGFDVLDRDALALLEGRGSLPPLPETLEGSEIQVIVPINYKLKKTT